MSGAKTLRRGEATANIATLDEMDRFRDRLAALWLAISGMDFVDNRERSIAHQVIDDLQINFDRIQTMLEETRELDTPPAVCTPPLMEAGE
ncbi:MAG: hypothetical protein AAF318_19975 [Pseudomonadota bacterium]